MVLVQVGITILGTIFGALVSYYLPGVIRWLRYSKREDLLGEWLSSYPRYQDREADEWVTETVSIDVSDGRFRLRNSSNSMNDLYEATAELAGGELSGTWKCLTGSGGHARGGLLLTIVPMGGIIYGVFTGPRDSGERVYGPWVLARKERDLFKGRDLIANLTLSDHKLLK